MYQAMTISGLIYLCVNRGINFAIEFWNCSDRVVFFLIFILFHRCFKVEFAGFLTCFTNMLQDAIRAFHNDLDKLKKYLKPLHLGAVQDIQNRSIDEDFRQLRSTAEQMVSLTVNCTHGNLYRFQHYRCCSFCHIQNKNVDIKYSAQGAFLE